MLSLAFSPCPNDTFIFDALVNKKIDTEGLNFEVHLEDVQTLNEWALQGKHQFTKISYGVLPLLINQYTVLNSGSALGKGVGPLLISHKPLMDSDIDDKIIAIPGIHTTAHLLFSLAYPTAVNKVFMQFNEIENYVLLNENALGVIIHENRFTYQQKGLDKVVDLGAFWEINRQVPIPLGGIVARKDVDIILAKKVDGLIKKSIEYAYQNYPTLSNYVTVNAQEMSEEVMQQHIDLYVNDFSLSLKQDGKNAIKELLKVYKNNHSEFDFNEQAIFLG
jgi:1,4-dihydroxy-6-naphthoate synthase